MTGFGFRLMTMWLALLAALLPMAARAQAMPHIKHRLIAESTAPRAGGTTTLALLMRPDPTWHGYWKNPGDAGVETSITWTAPPGVTVGPIQYPVPHTLIVSGLMNYVYEGPYAQLLTLDVPAGMAAGTKLPLRGEANWLACTDQICVPESATLSIDLVVGDGAVDPAAEAEFDGYRAMLPRPLGSRATFQSEGGRFRLGVPLPASATVAQAYFFPLTDGAIDYAAPQSATRDGDILVIETAARAGEPVPSKVEGLLKIGENEGLMLTAGPGPVPAGGTPLGGQAEAESGGAGVFLLALGGALIGGLLLNIMPCVFPILSLKALSLARSGGSEREARGEALAYSAGVIAVCIALGALLLALRAGGSTVGWAFQLQDPRVILLLLLLVAAIALNLAGLFELPAISGGDRLARSGGAGGAFWTGALAAFVATPCTGPFMGAALGAAVALPPAAGLAVFAGLGLGLALPFLLIGFVPALRKALPKPGAWMERFRRLLSLPMFATALGLAWILGRQAGVNAMTLGLAAALLIAVALWWVGRRQARGAGMAWWPLAPAAAAAIALMAVVPREPAIASARTDAVLGAEPFSEARLAALRGQGRPVFVYFTADWCLTCKVNEKGALERAEVAKTFKARNIAVLVGDWTRGDAAIGRFLSRQGRSGVPLYLFYPVKTTMPTVLPQLLTPGLLTDLGA